MGNPKKLSINPQKIKEMLSHTKYLKIPCCIKYYE